MSTLTNNCRLNDNHHSRYYLFGNFLNDLNKLFAHLSENNHTDLCQCSKPLWKRNVQSCDVKIDLQDEGSSLKMIADVPGVELTDMILTVTSHYLSLAGEKKAEFGEHDQKHCQMERRYGYFRRVVPLPCEVDKDHVDASYKDGVLVVSLPKSKAAIAEEKKLQVKAG